MKFTGSKDDLELAKIKQVLGEIELPAEVEEVRVNFDSDWSGERGLFVSFVVAAAPDFKDADVKRLSRFMSDVTDRLIRAGAPAFPYVTLQQAA